MKNKLKKHYMMLSNNLKMLTEKGAFHIFLGNLIIKFVVFFGSIFLVRILAKEDYALLGYIENIYGFAYLIVGCGMGNAISRFVVLGNTLEEKGSYYYYAIKFGSIFNIIVMAGALILNNMGLYLEKFELAILYFPIMMLMMPFQYLEESALYNERAFFKNKSFAAMSVIYSTSVIISRIIGAFTDGIRGVVIALLLIHITLAVLFQIHTKTKRYAKINISKLDKVFRKETLVYAIQYMLTNGIWQLFMLTDILLIGIFCENSVGIADYKVACVLPGALAIICNSIGTFVAPYFVKNEDNQHWVRENYIKTLVVSVVCIGGAVIVLFIFAEQFILLFYGQKYINIIGIMRILLIAAFFNSGLRYTTANLLAAMGQIKYNMTVSAISVVAQVLMNIYMIPRYDVYGAAYTGLIIYALMGAVMFLIFNKKYKILRTS